MPNEAKAPCFAQLVALLPPGNQAILKRLLGLLKEIIKHEQVNKMGVPNIAIIFAPSLLRAKNETPLDMMNNMMNQQKIVEYLIVNYENLFVKNPSKINLDEKTRNKWQQTLRRASIMLTVETLNEDEENSNICSPVAKRSSYKKVKKAKNIREVFGELASGDSLESTGEDNEEEEASTQHTEEEGFQAEEVNKQEEEVVTGENDSVNDNAEEDDWENDSQGEQCVVRRPPTRAPPRPPPVPAKTEASKENSECKENPAPKSASKPIVTSEKELKRKEKFASIRHSTIPDEEKKVMKQKLAGMFGGMPPPLKNAPAPNLLSKGGKDATEVKPKAVPKSVGATPMSERATEKPKKEKFLSKEEKPFSNSDLGAQKLPKFVFSVHKSAEELVEMVLQGKIIQVKSYFLALPPQEKAKQKEQFAKLLEKEQIKINI